MPWRLPICVHLSKVAKCILRAEPYLRVTRKTRCRPRQAGTTTAGSTCQGSAGAVPTPSPRLAACHAHRQFVRHARVRTIALFAYDDLPHLAGLGWRAAHRKPHRKAGPCWRRAHPAGCSSLVPYFHPPARRETAGSSETKASMAFVAAPSPRVAARHSLALLPLSRRTSSLLRMAGLLPVTLAAMMACDRFQHGNRQGGLRRRSGVLVHP
jgi:hypothetical protein